MREYVPKSNCVVALQDELTSLSEYSGAFPGNLISMMVTMLGENDG